MTWVALTNDIMVSESLAGTAFTFKNVNRNRVATIPNINITLAPRQEYSIDSRSLSTGFVRELEAMCSVRARDVRYNLRGNDYTYMWQDELVHFEDRWAAVHYPTDRDRQEQLQRANQHRNWIYNRRIETVEYNPTTATTGAVTAVQDLYQRLVDNRTEYERYARLDWMEYLRKDDSDKKELPPKESDVAASRPSGFKKFSQKAL